MRALGLVVVVVVSAWTTGCDVCDGDNVQRSSLSVTTQDDLDDLEDVVCVFGDLDIGPDIFDNPSITDLSPLESLEIVEGDMRVQATFAISDFSDLESLTWVGRRAFDPDPDGESVRGRLFIRDNGGLTKLDFPALTDVGGCIFVENNVLLDANDVNEFFADIKTHGSFACTDGAEVNQGNNG